MLFSVCSIWSLALEPPWDVELLDGRVGQSRACRVALPLRRPEQVLRLVKDGQVVEKVVHSPYQLPSLVSPLNGPTMSLVIQPP